MKKRFAILLFITLFSGIYSVSGSELVYETFQNYTSVVGGGTFNHSLFLQESGNVWACDGAGANASNRCSVTAGGSGTMTRDFYVMSQLGNKFMRIWSLGGDSTNYYNVGLRYNYSPTHFDYLPNTVWTKTYRIRLVYTDFMSYLGVDVNEGMCYEVDNVGFTPVGTQSRLGMGGVSTSNESDYTSLRYYFNTTAPSKMSPANGFDMSDGNWHYVTVYYHVNGTCHETYIEYYVDGLLQYNRTINNAGTCGVTTWATGYFLFHSLKSFVFDIDDIAMYNTSAALFTGIGDTATCDSYTLPYYLVESFGGSLSVCNWSTSYDYHFGGALELDSSMGFYYAQKEVKSPFDGTSLSSTASRYATMQFDLAVTDAASGKNVAVRLYDDSNQNAFLFWSDGNSFYYLNNGNSVWLANLSTSSYNWKFVFDLQRSKVDIYLNDVLLESQGDMAILNYFVKNIATFKITSSNVGYTFDNLQIYTSDSLGVTLLGDTTIIPVASNETTMCGLFRIYNGTAPSCNTDADCVTGDCMANGKCNSFDMTYCDENGYVRGNKCILAGIASCGGQGFSDVIFKNFLWVLVLLLILMAIVYLSIMVRRRQ